MNAKFLPRLTAIIILGVFAVMFITAISRLSTINEGPEVVDTDTAADVANIQNNLSGLLSATQSADAALSNSTTSTSAGGNSVIALTSLKGVAKTLKTIPLIIYDSTAGFLKRNLIGGSDYGWFVDVFAALIIFSVIVGFIYWLFSGDGGVSD